MRRPTRLSQVQERSWARFGALTASMFVVGTAAAVVATYPDANPGLAPSQRLGPEGIGVLIAQAAAVATVFCGAQSLLAAAALTWWRSRGHSALSQYVVAALAAALMTYLTMLVIDRPWTMSSGNGWGSGRDWASSTATLAMYLAVIYCGAQALAFCTRAWRKGPTNGTPG